MSDPDEPTAPPKGIEQRRAFIEALRRDLLSPDLHIRVEAQRRLFLDLARRKVVWFDRLGHVAQVENREGFRAALVELALVLSFPDEWPPD